MVIVIINFHLQNQQNHWCCKGKGALLKFFPGCVGTFSRNAILMGDQISWCSLLQRTLQVLPWFLTFHLSDIWHQISLSDQHPYPHQDQWLKQRSNPTMHQRGWLEIPHGKLIHKNVIAHEYLIFIFRLVTVTLEFSLLVDFQLLVTNLTFAAVSTLLERGFDDSESLILFPKKYIMWVCLFSPKS